VVRLPSEEVELASAELEADSEEELALSEVVEGAELEVDSAEDAVEEGVADVVSASPSPSRVKGTLQFSPTPSST